MVGSGSGRRRTHDRSVMWRYPPRFSGSSADEDRQPIAWGSRPPRLPPLRDARSFAHVENAIREASSLKTWWGKKKPLGRVVPEGDDDADVLHGRDRIPVIGHQRTLADGDAEISNLQSNSSRALRDAGTVPMQAAGHQVMATHREDTRSAKENSDQRAPRKEATCRNTLRDGGAIMTTKASRMGMPFSYNPAEMSGLIFLVRSCRNIRRRLR